MNPKHVIIVIGGASPPGLSLALWQARQLGAELELAHLPPGDHTVIVDAVVTPQTPVPPLRDIDIPPPMPLDGDLPKHGTRNGQKAVRQQKARELRRNRR